MENILSNAAASATILSRDEQLELVKRYQSGDIKALDGLVSSNLRLACKIASEHKRTGVDFEDLLAEAVQGIMRAATKYEMGSNASFTTYALQWIRAFCQKYVQDNASTIRVGTRTGLKLYASLQRIRRQHGPDVGADVIARELNADVRDVEEALQYVGRRAQSIDKAINENGGTVATLIADPAKTQHDIYEEVESAQALHTAITAFSASLDARDLEIFTTRSIAEDKRGLQEIGDSYGISKERVRQLENRILSNFKTYLLSNVEPEVLSAWG